MVIPVGPAKFYGSSLPRPRYFTGSDRVEPPVPVLDPLLSWAADAHWSMGGLSSTRLRLQGRIEGSVNKLRLQRENQQLSSADDVSDGFETRSRVSKREDSVSPPPAPVAAKRRRFMTLLDEEEEDEIEIREDRRLLVRNLGDDFDRVASENSVWSTEGIDRSGSVTCSTRMQTRNRRSEPAKDLESGKKRKISLSGDSSPASSTRSSPRLAKRGSTQ